MEIRFLNELDSMDEIKDLYVKSWRYAYKNIFSSNFLEDLCKNDIGHIEGYDTLVLIEDKKIIGTLSYTKSRWENYDCFGEIVSIYFLPEYIHKGYGKLLLNKGIDELKKLGYEKYLLWVFEENYNARKFYEKMGFNNSNEFVENNIGGKNVKELLYIRI